MTPEFSRQKEGKQEALLASIMNRIEASKDLFCAGKPIGTIEELYDEYGNISKTEHVRIIVAPKKPTYNSYGLRTLALKQITAGNEGESLELSDASLDMPDGTMNFIDLDFSVPIGIEKIETNTNATITAIDREALKRIGRHKKASHEHTVEERTLKNLITVHVFPDSLSAKIAFAYLSGKIEEQPYGSTLTNLDVRNNYGRVLVGELIQFLKKNQRMDAIEAAKAIEELVEDED